MYTRKIETLSATRPSLHSCIRWRAILVTAVTTEYETIARRVSPEHETKISIRFHSIPHRRKAAALQSSKRVPCDYLCHVHEIFALPKNAKIDEAWCT